MHDNFISHKTDEVYELFFRAGHTVICRVPYRPDEAPIEVVFNMLKCEIRRRWFMINNEVDLIAQIHDIIKTRAGMSGFDQLFVKCGYRCETDVVTDETDLEENEDEMSMVSTDDDDNESLDLVDALTAELGAADDLLLDRDPIDHRKDFYPIAVKAPLDGHKFDSSFTRLIKMPPNVDEPTVQMDNREEINREEIVHKHTVRTLGMLQDNMRAEGEGDSNGRGDDDDELKPTSLSYDKLSANTNSRRTVAGVFFELLRLKTWDFVGLEQSEPCSNIEIRAGPRFRERLVEGEVLKEGKSEDS